MPELPEVETVCRGITPHIVGQTIQHAVIRQPQLRWPVTDGLASILKGLTVQSVTRRGKYLLLQFELGTLLVHLGMSGSLRVVTQQDEIKTHDHIDIIFSPNTILRYNDPRRFGAMLWTKEAANQHALLKHLGPEPLLDDFHAGYLHKLAHNRKTPLKTFIMDSHVVVGVGNIYANEALFMAGLHPHRVSGQTSLMDYDRLVASIRTALQDAITQGGTTLRDFVNAAGKPGYFQQQLRVYGRSGLPCHQCGQPLQDSRLANRTTVFCAICQV
jgi:formamidopyrimidine-DNA glycosylase